RYWFEKYTIARSSTTNRRVLNRKQRLEKVSRPGGPGHGQDDWPAVRRDGHLESKPPAALTFGVNGRGNRPERLSACGKSQAVAVVNRFAPFRAVGQSGQQPGARRADRLRRQRAHDRHHRYAVSRPLFLAALPVTRRQAQ